MAITLSFAALFLLLQGYIPLPTVFIFNRTASLPIGWYVRMPARTYSIGDVVVFEPSDMVKRLAIERGWMQEEELLMKRIGALENMIWRIEDDGQFYVSDAYIGPVSAVDRLGRALPQIRGTYTVSRNAFLPVAASQGSFDGRYYGDVPLTNIRYKVIPLYTW